MSRTPSRSLALKDWLRCGRLVVKSKARGSDLLTRYIASAMKRARYRIIEDGQYFGEIPGFQGVWSCERSLDACREVLQEVLEEWLLLKIRDSDPLPKLGRIDLNIKAA